MGGLPRYARFAIGVGKWSLGAAAGWRDASEDVAGCVCGALLASRAKEHTTPVYGELGSWKGCNATRVVSSCVSARAAGRLSHKLSYSRETAFEDTAVERRVEAHFGCARAFLTSLLH